MNTLPLSSGSSRSATASAMESWYLRWSRGVLVEFIHANTHIMRQHEVEEALLLRIEARTDDDLSPGGPVPLGLSAMVDFMMLETAKCPNCKQKLTEKTLIEPT